MSFTTQGSPQITAHVLLYGRDNMLLQTRQWLLEQAGYRVTAVATYELAEQILTSAPVDVCILCHTLTDVQRRSLRSTIQELWPCVQMLQLSTAIGNTIRSVGQATLSTGDGPVALLDGVREAMDIRGSGDC